MALACDVLYEPYSVVPLANIVPRLLNPKSGRLLLADPSHRTEQNRQSFHSMMFLTPQSAKHWSNNSDCHRVHSLVICARHLNALMLSGTA